MSRLEESLALLRLVNLHRRYIDRPIPATLEDIEQLLADYDREVGLMPVLPAPSSPP